MQRHRLTTELVTSASSAATPASSNNATNQTGWPVDCWQLWNYSLNGIDCYGSGFETTANGSNLSSRLEGNRQDSEASRLWALPLMIFPLFTFFGNVLVALSVYRERSLRTVTNYFIVSLAVADIMVGVLVMPLAIYNEVKNSEWTLGTELCDTWVAFDVMCCTASILNLTAISVDRFIAVSYPIKYAKHKNSNRVYITLALTWVVSIAISSPIALGVNNTDERLKHPSRCAFFNADFLIYSSMGSFYIPTIIMILLYWRIFAAIRSRAKRAAALREKNRAPTSASVNHDLAPTTQPPDAVIRHNDAAGGLTTAASDTDSSRVAFIRSTSQFTRPPGTSLGAGLTTCVTTSDTSCTEDGGGSARELLPSARYRAHATIEEETSFVPPPTSTGVNVFKATVDVIDVPAAPGATNNNTCSGGFYKQSSVNTDGDRSSDYMHSHTSEDELAAAAAVASSNGGYRAPTHIEVEGAAAAACARGNGGAKLFPSTTAQFLAPPRRRESAESCDLSQPSKQSTPSRHRPSRNADKSGSDSGAAVSSGRIVTKFNFHILRPRRAPKTSKSNTEKNAHKREKKATKTLAIVLGVFLFCWLPFFTIQIINAICIRYELVDIRSECKIDPMLFSFFTWLGYINSFLNPIIYTIFNIEFRRAFKKILQHPCSYK